MRFPGRFGWTLVVGRAAAVATLSGVLVVGVTGCGFIGAHDSSTHGADSAATASPGPGGEQQITVTGNQQMSFTPNVIKAHTGKLKITLKVTGTTPHDLKVTKLHVNTGMVRKGKPVSIEVTLSHTGQYDFVCTYHRKQGMTGVIKVS